MATRDATRAPSDEGLRNELKTFIVEHLKLKNVNPALLTDDAPLVGGGLDLDSIDVLELVTGIEKRYGLRIEDPDVVVKVFTSVNTLASHITAHRDSA